MGVIRWALVGICALALPVMTSGCGGTDCGAGTREVDGECVPTATGGGDTGGDQNGNSNGSDQNNNNNDTGGGFDPDSCAPGTSAVGEQCVADPVLAGFTVAVSESCGTIVSDVVTLSVAITAVDGAGDTLDDFAGTVNLLGLGGVTPSVGSAVLVDGAATVDLTVSGVAESAQLLVLSDDGQISGRSASFAVVEEEISVSALDGPSMAVRAGAPFGVSASLESNGCRDLSDFEGSLVFSVTGGLDVTPSRVAIDGGEMVMADIALSGALEPTTVTLTASLLANGSARAADVAVVPELEFAGITDALLLSDGTVELSWAAASGGSGESDRVYTGYRSTAAGTLGEALTPSATGAETRVVVPLPAAPTAGDTFFFTVRVEDALMDGSDTNLIQLPVVFGNIVYVDIDNAVSVSKDGSASEPFSSLAEALTEVGAGPGTIYVSEDTYDETLDLSATTGVQINGGFQGWVSNASTAADWTRGVNRTVVNLTAAATALTAGSGTVVSGISFTSLAAGASVGAAASLTVLNSDFTGTSPVISAAGPLALSGTDVSGTGTTPTCLDSSVDASVNGGIFSCTGIDINAVGRLSVRGTDLSRLARVVFGGGSLLELADGVEFNGSGSTATCLVIGTSVGLDEPDVDIDGITMTSCEVAIEGANDTALRSFVMTGSTAVSGLDLGEVRLVGDETMTTPIRLADNDLQIQDRGSPPAFTVEAEPAAHDIVIEDNSFQAAGIDLQLGDNSAGTASTVIVQNNTFNTSRTGLNIETFGTENNDLDVLIERNQFSGNFNGRGDATVIRAFPNGNTNFVVVDNEFRRIDRLLNFYSTGDGATNVAFGRNDWSGGFGRYPGNGAVYISTGASDGGAVEVYENEFDPSEQFLSATALRVISNGNSNNRNDEVDLVVRDNDLGLGNVDLSSTGNINVSGNEIEANYVPLQVNLGEAIADLNAERRVNVIANDILVTSTFVADSLARIEARSGPDDDHTLVIEDNQVLTSATNVNSDGRGLFVRSRGNTNSNQSVQVSGNTISGMGVSANAYAVGGNVDMSFVRNAILSPESRGIRTFVETFGSTVTTEAADNAIVALSRPIRMSVQDDSLGEDSPVAVTVARNLMVAGSTSEMVDVSVFPTESAIALNGTFANNVFVGFEDFEEGTPSGAIGIDASTTPPVALAAVHNSVIGPFDGPVFQFNVDPVGEGSTVDVVDNLIDAPVASAADVVSVMSNPVNVTSTISNNLAPVAGTGLVEGSPTYESVITDVFIFREEDGLRFSVASGNTPALGARLLLVGEAFARVVSDVSGSDVELDGPARAVAVGDVIGLVLSPASGPFPTYGLVPGTTGADAASDEGDIGASGGAMPYVPLMP